jgi:hypothetical protein
MIFCIFGRAKPPPLTAYCANLSDPMVLLKLADSMTTGDSKIDKRAIVLSLSVMAAAGNFVKSLCSDETEIQKTLQQYLRGTNLDVIAAEAIVWVHFLMERLWLSQAPRRPASGWCLRPIFFF